MEPRWAEVKAIDVSQGTRLLQRRWKILLAVTGASMLLAIIISFFVSPIWESRVNIQLGVIDGEPLEDPRVLARILESDEVWKSAPPNNSVRQPVRVQIVESIPGGTVAYLRVLGRGPTPEEARDRASQAVEFARQRHAELSQGLLAHSLEYQKTLASTVKHLEDSIASLESVIGSLKADKRDGTVAAVLYQAQLELQRSEFLKLARELRDSQMKDALGTRQTRAMGPPSTSPEPIWPQLWVFAVVGGAVGFALAAVGVLMFAR